MKIDTSEVKRWTILNIEWQLFKVTDMSHTHTWRWWATYNFRVKNIVTWATNNFTYKSGTTLEKADVNTKNALYLYNSWDTYSFMESDSSEIYDLSYDDVSDIAAYLKENLDVFLMIYNEKVIGVILPTTITYKIVETVPWIKWNRATSWTKPAKTETWLEVQVPLHYEEGDEVVVNTDTWKIS